MGGAPRTWAALLLLVLFVDISLASPPLKTATKRTDENIQFGNQQNKPVSVLDEDAQLGAFPSSETIENEEDQQKPVSVPAAGGDQSESELEEEEEEEEEADHDTKTIQDIVEEEQHEDQGQDLPAPPHAHIDPPSLPAEGREGSLRVSPVSQHDGHHPVPIHREEMISDLPPVALASRWRSPAEFYNPREHWGMPLSPFYGTVDGGTFPAVRRRRRATEHHNQKVDPKKVIQVSLHALRTGHRHKREVNDIRRIRRDLSNIDLDKLRREVDVVELLAMLAKPPRHHSSGFATVTYAPLAPAPPRFAPQPKLFPDYDEEEEDEDDDEGSMGLLQQSVRPPTATGRVMMPSEDRIWRRSGPGYGLSAMPGFKRSVFRANNPQPPHRQLNPGDVYSLAAMLGAELDPVTHRLRRAAM